MPEDGFSQPTLASALKEWAIAVDALAAGATIVLLRKGGIREQGGRFTVQRHRVWLYPTFEHQQPHLLKPAYADAVQPVASGWHPEAVSIAAWADITAVFSVSAAAAVAALLPFHVWNEQFVAERLRWKPRQPIDVLLLRTYRLETPHAIAYRPEYGGCKSWIELLKPLSMAGSRPALTETAYAQQVEAVRRAIAAIEPEAVGAGA